MPRASGECLPIRSLAEDRERRPEALAPHTGERVEQQIEALLRPEAAGSHDVRARTRVRAFAAPRLLGDARHVDGIVDAGHLAATGADTRRDLACCAIGLGDDAVGGADAPEVEAVEQLAMAAVLEVPLADHLADHEPGRREQRTDEQEGEVHVALRRGDGGGSEPPDRADQRRERTAKPRRAEPVHRHVGRHLAEIRAGRVGQHQMGLEAPPVEMAEHGHHDTLGTAAVKARKCEQDARGHGARPRRADPPAARRCGRGRSARGRGLELSSRAGGRARGRAGCGPARR